MRGAPGGAAQAAPPTSPLGLVEAAVAGIGLAELVRLAAEGCATAIAVSLPEHGGLFAWPTTGGDPERDAALGRFAADLIAGTSQPLPSGVSDAVAVRVGPAVVGTVAALGHGPAEIALRPWLDAAAVAVAMTTLGHEASPPDPDVSRRRLLEQLETGGPEVVAAHDTARRLGVDLSAGAVAVCALRPDADAAPELSDPDRTGPVWTLPDLDGVLGAPAGAGRWLGLVSLARPDAAAVVDGLLDALRASGAVVARATPRAAAAELAEALAEAALMAELGLRWGCELADGALAETYRLLVGIFLRRPDELERLRTLTVAELERYDGQHDTELLGTLQQFLSHHGSTTETAEAMSLHRHTVGYRLARVHEVAGLSPYESDGRERLSLGLKADRILAAERVRRARRDGV